MMALLGYFFGSIPWRAWIAAGACVVLALALGWFVHHERSIGAQKEHAARVEEQRAAAAAVTKQRAAEESAQKEIASEAQRLSIRAVADAADVHAAAQRLRDRAVAAGDRAAASAAAGSAPASSAGLVPAELFSRALEEAGRLAALADQRGIAGDACVAAYGALR